MKKGHNHLMFLTGSKKLKILLVLFTFVGLVFSFSCAFTHHSETSAHAATPESVALLAQGNEACCGTGLSKSDHSLKETFLTLPKNHVRDLYEVLIIGLIIISVVIGRRLVEPIEQQLSFFVRFYRRQNAEVFAFYYLQLAFSRGILNPKKYNVVFSR